MIQVSSEKIRGPQFGENSISLVRLIAAWGVLWSHSYTLYGYHQFEPFVAMQSTINIGSLCVYTFLILSGFLLIQSAEHTHSLADFFFKRIRRIFPGLIVANFFVVLVVGSFFSTLPLKQYLTHPETRWYLTNSLLITHSFKYWLPGVFKENITPIVNGSLWTLSYEFLCYIFLGVLFYIFRIRSKFIYLCIWLCLIFTQLFPQFFSFLDTLSVLIVQPNKVLTLLTYFVGGIVMQMFMAKKKYSPLFGCVAFLLCVLFFQSTQTAIFATALLPFAITSLSTAKPLFLSGLSKKLHTFDISYGLYLYGWVMEQSLAVFVPNLPYPQYLLLVTYCTYGLAFYSWMFIESPVLRYRLLMKSSD